MLSDKDTQELLVFIKKAEQIIKNYHELLDLKITIKSYLNKQGCKCAIEDLKCERCRIIELIEQ